MACGGTCVKWGQAAFCGARASADSSVCSRASSGKPLRLNRGARVLVPADTVTDHMLRVVAALKEHKCLAGEVQGRVAAARAVEELYDCAGTGVNGGICCR